MERCREDKETVQCERAVFLFACAQADGSTGSDTLSLKRLYHSCHLLDSKQTRVRAQHLRGTDARWSGECLQSRTRRRTHTKSSVSCLGKWKEGASSPACLFISLSLPLSFLLKHSTHIKPHAHVSA